MHNEKPILFSKPMVLALLNGTKTQTRREVKGLPPDASDHLVQIMVSGHHADHGHVTCPYGKVGDRLWVRETWEPRGFCDEECTEFGIKYAADGGFMIGEFTDYDRNEKYSDIVHAEMAEKGIALHPNGRFVDKNVKFRNRPGIHMWKEFSRLWLEVVSVRVERLTSINEADILNEGIRIPISEGKILWKIGEDNSALSFLPKRVYNSETGKLLATQQQVLFAHWAELWCNINGRESWDANPWVWVIEFKELSRTGVDAIKEEPAA